MRAVTALMMCGLLAAPALAGIISTQYFADESELPAWLTGFEFAARGDTESLQLIPAAAPGDAVSVPYNLWESGVERGFQAVYDVGGIPAGMGAGDVQAIYETIIPINPATNGLLITTYAVGEDRSVLLDNLTITLPGFAMVSVGLPATSPGGQSILLVETDLPLESGFILSGTATLTWTGDLAPPSEQWFEIEPVVTPEPASALLLGLGLALAGLRRLR